MTRPRVVTPEALDHLPPDDPAARRSRRDLQRVHRAMGTRAMLRRAIWPMLSRHRLERPGAPYRVLELGAGDGSLLLGVALAIHPAHGHGHQEGPQVELCLLDRQPIVEPATLARYAAVGWNARTQLADVLDWVGGPSPALPAWELIVANLFLHHFETAPLATLLGAIASRAERFLAIEPRRSALALAGSHAVGLLGANAVTRQDAVLSVHAGFRDVELSALWPGGALAAPGSRSLDAVDAVHAAPAAAPRWQIVERRAGLFSHRFDAERLPAA